MRKYRPFWHRFNKYDQAYIIDHSDLTIGQFMKKYRQPPWCNYYQALGGWLGCWSLMDCLIHCEDDCCDCDCNEERKKKVKKVT